MLLWVLEELLVSNGWVMAAVRSGADRATKVMDKKTVSNDWNLPRGIHSLSVGLISITAIDRSAVLIDLPIRQSVMMKGTEYHLFHRL